LTESALTVRSTERGDIPALQQIVEATGLFPAEYLPDMVAGCTAGDAVDECWLTCQCGQSGGDIVGLCFARAEPFTDGTWNMLALGVEPARQREGFGRALVQHLEERLHGDGTRLLIVDTSGTDEFIGARTFYTSCGYNEEARIRDFWSAGDDKITFRKSL